MAVAASLILWGAIGPPSSLFGLRLRFSGWVLFGLALVLMASPAFAQPRPFVMVTEIWPPFRIAGPETAPDQFTGIDIDFLAALSQKIGLAFTVSQCPWARCLKMLENGEADMILGVAFTPQRAEFLHYSEIPYYVVSPVLYTQKGKGSQIQTYDDLYNYQIGYVLGSAYFEPFNSDTKLKKIGVSQEIQLVKMLASGRLEVIVGTNPNLQYDISQQGLKDKVEKTAYSPPVQTDLFVGVSKKSPLAARMNEINQAVRSLVESGEVNRIAEKYF